MYLINKILIVRDLNDNIPLTYERIKQRSPKNCTKTAAKPFSFSSLEPLITVTLSSSRHRDQGEKTARIW